MKTHSSPLEVLAELLNRQLEADVEVGPDGSLDLMTGSGRAVTVVLTEDEQQLVFRSPLASLSGPRGVLYMAQALASNLYQAETRGGVIGLDLNAHLLVFSYLLPVSRADAETLLVVLMNFCDTAEALAETLEESAGAAEPEELEALAHLPTTERTGEPPAPPDPGLRA